jgi:SNF2 family DNA or RNA helicase
VEIIDNKGLLLRVKDPEKITSVIPKSKQLGDNQVLVKWGVEEAQVLKNLGIKNIPSPIGTNYKWCGMYTPFNHQKVTAEFLTLHRRAFCFNEAGSGKTGSVIWAADYLMNLGLIRRVLVLCPLSIMQAAWEADLFRIAMHRTVGIAYSHSAKKRKAIASSDAEFIICNFDGLEIIKNEVMEGGFDLIVVDECTYYKTETTKRYKTFMSVIQPHTWVWMLTGTPAAQSPLDAYGLAKIINPNGVPRFKGAFKDSVMYKVSQFQWIPKENSAQIVHQALQPAIRFTKQECLDLPEMLYTVRDTPLSAQQLKYYETMRKHMMTIAAGEEITAANAAVILSKLLQLSAGCVYADNGEVVQFDVKNRISALLEVIDEASHKVLVFVPFRHAIDLVFSELQKAKIACETIHGDVSPSKRTDIFNRFQTSDDLQVLVVQPTTASHGVTLHAANVVVWWGPIYSVDTYVQANARVHRAGQKNPCTVVHLQGSPMEKRVYKMLESKIDVHTSVVELYKNIIGEKSE